MRIIAGRADSQTAGQTEDRLTGGRTVRWAVRHGGPDEQEGNQTSVLRGRGENGERRGGDGRGREGGEAAEERKGRKEAGEGGREGRAGRKEGR